MLKEEIVKKSLATESDEIVLQLVSPVDNKDWRKRLEWLLIEGRFDEGLEMFLERMLRFLAEIPVDKYHDYSDFRHKGLRGYLINRFLTEKWRTQ